jgi:hypothetical protein
MLATSLRGGQTYMLWDVFISHASEDKASVARPLALALQQAGLRVWFDETQLRVGDSLRTKIDEGLAQSRFGIVVLSPSFFAKDWPQRELAGLFARGGRDDPVILPVWHGLSARDVAGFSPMLADLVALSTGIGIPFVAEQIVEVVAPFLRPGPGPNAMPYSGGLEFPEEITRHAIRVIESVMDPATWPHMEFSLPGYPKTGWLGSDSSTFAEIIYGFAAPLYAAQSLSYAVRRKAAFLSKKSNVQFALLQAALDLFLAEGELASMAPAIPYTPRVSDWREKRIETPSKYWWQGLSPDRFDKAKSFFLKPPPSPGAIYDLVTADEFRQTYKALSSGGGREVASQQAIGLLGNGFFGFTPLTRPVLWRVLICHLRLYRAALSDLTAISETAPVAVEQVVPPCILPASLDGVALYESFDATMAATTNYLELLVLPKLRAAAMRTEES